MPAVPGQAANRKLSLVDSQKCENKSLRGSVPRRPSLCAQDMRNRLRFASGVGHVQNGEPKPDPKFLKKNKAKKAGA